MQEKKTPTYIKMSLVLQSIIQISIIYSVYVTAQLSFHTDAHKNSFTLQTPSLQQTFTRYYGGHAAAPVQTANQINSKGTDGIINEPLTPTYSQQILQLQQQQQQQHQFQQEQQQVKTYFYMLYVLTKI